MSTMNEDGQKSGPEPFADGPTLEIGHPVFMNYRGEELVPPVKLLESLLERLEAIGRESEETTPDPRWAGIALRQIYEIVDELGEAIAAKMACNAGCSACCRVMVSTSAIEADLIRERLKKSPEQDRNQWSILSGERNKRLSALARQTDPPQDLTTFEGLLATCEDWEKENLPCPFLGEGNLCAIYEDRPLLCRVCWVLTDPKDCDPGEGPPVKFRTKVFEKAYFVVAALSLRHLQNGAVSPIPWWITSR